MSGAVPPLGSYIPEASGSTGRFAQAGAWKHTKGTGDHRHFIAQDVAEEIFREHHIEGLRIF
jgi:hypothetical protein